MNEISNSLQRAFDRVQDFEDVHVSATFDEKVDAVLLLQEAVALGDGSREVIRDRLGQFDRSGHTGQILYGIIVGLLTAQLEAESKHPTTESA